MTCCSMYVGDPADFDVAGGNWDGHLPARLTTSFPPVQGDSYNGKFDEWVLKEGVKATKVDFDGYAARVTKAQIKAFIEYCYGADSTYSSPDSPLAHLFQTLVALRKQVEALDEKAEYFLVSECY